MADPSGPEEDFAGGVTGGEASNGFVESIVRVVDKRRQQRLFGGK